VLTPALGLGANVNIKTGTMIAIAAGGLFASACKKEEAKQDEKPTKMEAPKPDEGSSATAPKPDEVKPEATEQVSKVDCAGINACKGQGTCKTATSGCGGQNECKGKGVIAMTEAECKEKGGTIANK
jgi:hypothetical protein